MKRAALLVLALTAALVVLPGTAAFACSCASPAVAEQVGRADLVVRGTVGEPQGDATVVTYPVEVVVAYKGSPAQHERVRSPRDGASCGLEVVPGREYVLFANEGGDGFEARLCGGTAPADRELVQQVEAVTGPGRVVRAGPATVSASPVAHTPVAAPPAGATDGPGRASTPALVGLGVLVVVAAVAGAVVRRRRA